MGVPLLIVVAACVSLGSGFGSNFNPRPQDCVVDYSRWSLCDVNRGQGQQERWGTVRQPASNGGRQCPPLEQSRPCDSGVPCTPSPVDCEIEFSAWTECSKPCNGGKRQRWGRISRAPAFGGQPCLELEQEEDCSTHSCQLANLSPSSYLAVVRQKRRSQPVILPTLEFRTLFAIRYFCGGAENCETCRGKIESNGQFRSITCPADAALYETNQQCAQQCRNLEPTLPVYNKRPKREASTKFYCAKDVEGGDPDVEGCKPCTKTTTGSDCPKFAKELFDSKELCEEDCSKSDSSDGQSSYGSRTKRSFPARPSPVFRIPTRPLSYRPKPKVQFDCSRKEDGTYPNSRSKCSNVFYMCSNGGADEMKCATNLFYNHEIKECDIHAYVPACSGGRRPATTTPEPRRIVKVTPDPEFDCTKRPNDVFEDPRQKCSSKFYSCSNGQTTREVCPENLFYDSKTKSCLSWASIYKCSGKVPKKPIVKLTKNFFPPKKVPVDCRKLGNGAFPDPRKQCSQTWYNCANGYGYEMTCPALTFFNPLLKDCDSYNNIFACSRRKPTPLIPTPPAPQPIKYPFDCSNRADGFYKAGICLRFYWACSGGVTQKMPCGKDMVYDTELKICDFKFNIPKCGGVRPKLPLRIPFKPKQPVNFDCVKRKDGNYPAGMCRPIYYACSGGSANKMQCPHSLFYDSDTKACDKKKYIPECGGKRQPKTFPTFPKFLTRRNNVPQPSVFPKFPNFSTRRNNVPQPSVFPKFPNFSTRRNNVPQPSVITERVRPQPVLIRPKPSRFTTVFNAGNSIGSNIAARSYIRPNISARNSDPPNFDANKFRPNITARQFRPSLDDRKPVRSSIRSNFDTRNSIRSNLADLAGRTRRTQDPQGASGPSAGGVIGGKVQVSG